MEHFKIEGILALQEVIEKEDFIVKLDSKDAYTVVPIHKDSNPFLAFENQFFQRRTVSNSLLPLRKRFDFGV